MRRLLLILAAAATPALSAERLQDISPIQRVQGQARWESDRTRGPGVDRWIMATPPWEVRLAIPPRYLQPARPVRVYLVVPRQIPGLRGSAGLELSWTTQGLFLNGTARPGDRALIFQGRPQGPTLSDVVTFTLRVEGRETIGPLDFETVYEIEEAS